MRGGVLLEEVASLENLYRAWRRAEKGKKWTRPSGKFGLEAERELLRLHRELLSGEWWPGKLTVFRIQDPKERTIQAPPFRDRVVHHALVGVLEPFFEAGFDEDSFACRKGKGMDAALRRAVELTGRSGWILKTDIRKCYESVDLKRLKGILREWFPGEERLLELFRRILGRDGRVGRGLPIGSLTSQWLANLYLDKLDRFVREGIGPLGYIRYMDDFALFGMEKDEVLGWRGELETALGEILGLHLKEKATGVYRGDRGWPFLGFRVWEGGLELRRNRQRRYRRRLGERYHRYVRGRISKEEFLAAAGSLAAHVRRARAKVGWAADLACLEMRAG